MTKNWCLRQLTQIASSGPTKCGTLSGQFFSIYRYRYWESKTFFLLYHMRQYTHFFGCDHILTNHNYEMNRLKAVSIFYLFCLPSKYLSSYFKHWKTAQWLGISQTQSWCIWAPTLKCWKTFQKSAQYCHQMGINSRQTLNRKLTVEVGVFFRSVEAT